MSIRRWPRPSARRLTYILAGWPNSSRLTSSCPIKHYKTDPISGAHVKELLAERSKKAYECRTDIFHGTERHRNRSP